MNRIQLAGGGGGCFLGHTLVRVPDGQQRIDELKPGDLVVSFDDQGGLHHAKVLKVHEHDGERVLRYRLWGGATLDATPNHWVLNQFNAFVEIDTLGPDDCLVDENGHLRPIVSKAEFCNGTVYNLTVEGHHTFIAGGIRVHNAGLGLGRIAGAGGGGGKGGGGGDDPETDPDSLDSRQYAKLIDLISEGEIEGVKGGLKGIYVNNTPLQNPDNSYNFKNFEVYTRNGTQDQTELPIFGEVENEKPVGVVVSADIPIVRTIVDPEVEAVRITVNVPQLQNFQEDGDIRGSDARVLIYVQYNGGGYTLRVDDWIRGRTADLYQRDYVISLDGQFPIDIKVSRGDPDSTSARIINAFSWSSYTEIVYAKLRYPNSALVGIRVDAEQFSSIPQRSYLVRGIKIRIPNNATVDSTNGRLIYSGVWTGTFGAAQWCSDPAWILWDLLTSKRYGLGDHLDASQLDKWAFYSASQYCNQLVPDGFGGTEPRFSCNVNIQTAEEAFKLINDMSSVFRAMPFWSTGALTVSQDKPADTAYLFTLANVTEQGFTYQSSSQKTRPTVVVVGYLDLTLRDIAYEVVEDVAAIAKYGVVKEQVSAFACTSRGQASRIGQWILYSEQYENEIVSFTASIDAGVVVRPGQIIEIADPMRAGARRGGRITSATTQQIQVDNATGLTAGNNRTLSVILPDGTAEERNVSVISGNLITVSSPFSKAPSTGSVWLYQTSDLQTSTWRVLGVQEQDGSDYVVNAIAYNASKYDYIDLDRPLTTRDVTNLNEIPAAPATLTLTEALYKYQSTIRAKVIASWPSVMGVNEYQVRWRKDNGNWTIINKQGLDYELLDITPGLFEFQVYSVSPARKFSNIPVTASINALGKTAPPNNVSGFSYTIDPFIGCTLNWTAVSDIDVDFYEIRVGTAWSTATLLTQVKATSFKVGYLDDGTQTYLIKAVDTSGVYSTTATSVAVTISLPGAVTVTSQIEDPVVELNWTPPAITSYAIDYYRITYGNVYATSTELTQTKSTSFSVPVTWSGSRTFWVVPVDIVGNVATTQGSTVVAITAAAAPTVTGTIAGTTATLNWNTVNGTLATTGYEIRRGATYSTATVLASITGTTYTVRADWSGSQTFWVAAFDANGSLGTAGSVALTVSAAGAPSITSQFAGRDVVISWSAVSGTLDTDYYIIKRGSTFGGGTTVATAYATAYTLRVDWGGSQRFWIAAVDINGLVGTAGSIDIAVTAPGVPTISQQVVDNNVLLRWNDVTASLPIEYYELRKGSTWAGATVIGTKQGGFTTVFESQSGTYTYWLAGVDSAGNYGTPGSVAAQVNQPPDYVLQLDQNSSWAGAKTNVYTDPLYVETRYWAQGYSETSNAIVNVNTTETWQSHFTSRGYNTPQDQITAGFDYYLMPSTTSALYEEEIDYGAILAGTKVAATLTSTNVVGATTITPTIRVRGTTGTSATYSQSGTTTITVTSTAHGLVAGDYVYLDFTSGTATDGTYVVATAVANSFTVTASAAATTSGNASWIKWTTYTGVSEVFANNFRYFRIRYDFASSGNNDLLLLTNLNIKLSSKLINDAGSGTANSGDSGGTTVTFSVPFVDVQSIVVTPATTTATIAVYDFLDVPNPTSFKVLLFNTSGTRVSGGFSWTARGV